MLSLIQRFAELERLVSERADAWSFLSPLTACGWAALCRAGRRPDARLQDDAMTYADTVGLLDVMNGDVPHRQPVPGNRYSPLVELTTHAAVEPANAVINDLIRGQLAAYPALAGQACIVTGELHDNVPSHATGVGFAMAQYYPASQALELAVADNGCGMLRNVSAIIPEITRHAEAVEWCVQEGNTTVQAADDWAQHMPEDAFENPYGDGIDTRGNDNHHVGLGLWKLAEICRATNGSLGVWSGDARWQIHAGKAETVAAPVWQGVVAGLRLPVAAAVDDDGEYRLQALENLAARLRL